MRRSSVGCLVAELGVHSRLNSAVKVTQALFAFVTVAVLATDHGVGQRINIDSRCWCWCVGRGTEFLVDSRLPAA